MRRDRRRGEKKNVPALLIHRRDHIIIILTDLVELGHARLALFLGGVGDGVVVDGADLGWVAVPVREILVEARLGETRWEEGCHFDVDLFLVNESSEGAEGVIW